MKKLFLLFIIFNSIKIFSQSNINVNLKFDNDTVDFGDVKEGDTIIYDFWFTNIGTENLIIKQAYPACGCTTPTYTQGEIKPGERGFIHVKFRSEGFGGTQVLKYIIIINNGPERNAIFKANVISTKPKEIKIDYSTKSKSKKKKKKKK